MSHIFLIVSSGFVVYIWFLFPLLLKILTLVFQRQVGNQEPISDTVPEARYAIAVIIAAHNEEANVQRRITNIYDSDYPSDCIHVIIASDGSTDGTYEKAQEMSSFHPLVRALEVSPQGGRAAAHNFAVRHLEADIDILVFTDAETTFDRETLGRLVVPFAETGVGYVAGTLHYLNQRETYITQSAGLYWRFEQYLRSQETALGLFVFGTGACCAVRQSLYRDIPPTGDVDFTTPLDVVLHGNRCVQVSNALAWDVMPASQVDELKARVRMTSKNLNGTIRRWGWRGFFSRPVYSWIILSHKVGRWLTPFALLTFLFATMAAFTDVLGQALFAAQLVFYGAGVSHYLTGRGRLSGAIYSFILANVGFFVGTLKVLFGQVPSSYIPLSQGGGRGKGTSHE